MKRLLLLACLLSAPSWATCLRWSTAQFMGKPLTYCSLYAPTGTTGYVGLDADGNAAIGTTCPGGAPAGSLCANGKVYSGGAEVSGVTDFTATVDAGTDTVTISAGRARFDNIPYDLSISTAVGPTGAGNVYFYVDGTTHALAAGKGVGVSSAGTLTNIGNGGDVTTPFWPSGSIPIAVCTVASSNYDTCASYKAYLASETASGASYAYHSYTGTSLVDFSTHNDVLVTASGANVTITVTDPALAGTPVNIGLCNDGTARTWTVPASFKRIGTPVLASTCVYTPAVWDGTNYQGSGSDETPSILRYSAERADPGAGGCPGGGCDFVDSTAHNKRFRNSSDVLSAPVKTGVDIDPDTGVVGGINGVPLCSGISPANAQYLKYTTGGTPDPCWTTAAVVGGSGSSVVDVVLQNATLASSTTSHYFQGIKEANTATTSCANSQLQIPVSGTLVAVYVELYNGSAISGQGTDTAIRACINGTTGTTCNGTSVTVTTGAAMPAQYGTNHYSATGLSQAVTAGDKINVDLVPGTYTSNASAFVRMQLVIQ